MSIKDALKKAQELRARRKAEAERPKPAARADKPDAGRRSRALREAEEARARYEAELAAQRRELEDLKAARLAEERSRLAAQRVEYAKRAGARVAPDVLARVLPDVDPRTPEGLQALEKFRADNAALFAPVPMKPADISGEVTQRVDKAATVKGRQPLADRKVFGVELVKRTIAKNLGGAE
jgi:hypothetical protein